MSSSVKIPQRTVNFSLTEELRSSDGGDVALCPPLATPLLLSLLFLDWRSLLDTCCDLNQIKNAHEKTHLHEGATKTPHFPDVLRTFKFVSMKLLSYKCMLTYQTVSWCKKYW